MPAVSHPAVRRSRDASKVRALAGRNDRAVPLARSPECIEDLIPENRIGQHGPDFIKHRYRRAEGSVGYCATDLLIDGSRDGERDGGLQFRGLF